MIRYVLASCLFLISLNLISCSDQKDQLPKGQGVPNPVVDTTAMEEGISPSEQDDRIYIPGNVTGRDPNTGFDPREGLDNERDNLTEVNSKQPILFDGENPNNSGLAGITFKTTLDEASLILSNAVEYDCGFFYEEGMCIEWQKDGAQRPKQMIIVQNYLGEIELPAPIGKIRMGTDLKRFFQANDPVGKSVVEMLYRSFFKVADPAYSCIQDGKCEAREVENAIIWRLPNIFFQLSKEGGNQLFLILLENKFDSGILKADFDLSNHSFSDGQATVQLGQSWGEVKTLGEVQDVESVIQTTNFRKDYDGVNVWVYRPDAFNSKAVVSPSSARTAPLSSSFVAPIEAEDKDVFGGVSLFGSYPGKFKIDGEYVKINLQGDVVLSTDTTESTSEFLLKTQLPWLADNYDLQVKILKNLEIALSKALATKLGANIKTSVRFDGLESRPAANKWINFTINYFAEKSPTEFESGFVFVGMSVRTGYVQILKEISFDPFIKTISDGFAQEILLPLPSVAAAPVALVSPAAVIASALPVDPATSLGGFSLGEEVEFNQIDWLRSEANFVKDGKSVRVAFEPRSYIRVSYLDNETEILNVWTVTGLARISLGLTPLTANPYGQSSIKFKVSAVTSHLNPVGIRGLCGFDTLVARDSSYYDVRTVLIDEIKNKKTNCAFFGRGNNAEDGEYDQMFFPSQKVKLIFTEKLFTGVTIYE